MRGRDLTEGWHEELQHRVRALLIITGDLVTADQLALLNDLVDANEYGIAFEMLAEMLLSSGARVGTFGTMWSLSSQMGLDDSQVVDQLRSLTQ